MKIAVFDIEAENWIHLKVLGFYDGENYKLFYDVKSFLKHVLKKKYDGYRIYAHSGGKYDFLFLLEELVKYKIRLIENGGRIISIYVDGENYSLSFCDSYAILPSSLKDLTISFDVEHKKKEFKFANNRKLEVNEKLLSYLENDVLGLYEVLTKFYSSEFIVNPKLTIASQALDTFQNKFLESDLVPFKSKDELVFRKFFYSGGRVEAYKGKGENLKVYDINSLFPYAMTYEMPVGNYEKVRFWNRDKIGFYKINVKHDTNFYIPPFLMKKSPVLKNNAYVNAKGYFYVSSEWLKFFKEIGIKFEIEWGWEFKRKEYLFNDYVSYFYDIKNKHSDKRDSIYYISKLFLNSLYGKLAQERVRNSVESILNINIHKDKFDILNVESLNYGLVLVKRKSKSRFILPYLAGYITDIARLHHYKYMFEKQEEIYYCDTDSLITTADYPVSEKLGDFKLEGSGFKGVFLGNKTYALRNDKYEYVKFKGFDSENLTFDEMVEALHGKPVKQEKERMLSFRESLRRKNGIIDSQGQFLKLVSMSKETDFSVFNRKKVQSDLYYYDTIPYTYTEIK